MKVAPLPRVLRTSMVPLCALMRLLTIASPSPAPPLSPDRDLSTIPHSQYCTMMIPSPLGKIKGQASVQKVNLDYKIAAVISGYNLFSPINSTNTYLMDNDGITIKTWMSSYGPGDSVYLLNDSTLMRTANTGSTNFDPG